MIKKKIGKNNTYFFENFLQYKDIFHFISTKEWGNLGFHVGDDPKKVLENRKNISSSLKIPFSNFVFANQVHGKNIAVITAKEKGRGSISQEDAIESMDGLITKEKNICLMILVADCVPILIFDPVKKVIAAIHAGRKGTSLQIAKEAVKTFKEKFKSNPKDLVIGLGPSIGPCHYEVDLWEENKKQLIKSGVLAKNIEESKICTYCNKSEFFSARGEGETGLSVSQASLLVDQSGAVGTRALRAGRFAVGIILKLEDNI
ncbi:laccase domain-containing protein [Candidatus Microgenomates bacterium]|nr:MAG: laccase domain-containing protein [Candidatus Microgenomates bacterium]